MAYITISDIQARMPADAYVRVFDRDDDGEVTSAADTTFVTTCINTSQSVVDTELYEAFPDPLDSNGKTVDERVKAAQVMIAIYEAVRYSFIASGDTNSSYRKNYDDAIAMLRQIKADTIRLKTANGGGAAPRTRLTGVTGGTDALGEPTNPYTRARDGRDDSDF